MHGLRQLQELGSYPLGLYMLRHPQFQGNGIGSALLQAAEDYYFDKMETLTPQKNILVATTNDNILALAFYQKKGYFLVDAKLGAMVGHHNDNEKGVFGIPIRDVLVLSKDR